MVEEEDYGPMHLMCEFVDTGGDSKTHADSTGMKAYVVPEVHEVQRVVTSQHKEVKAYVAPEVHGVRRGATSQGKGVVAKRKDNTQGARHNISNVVWRKKDSAAPRTEERSSPAESGGQSTLGWARDLARPEQRAAQRGSSQGEEPVWSSNMHGGDAFAEQPEIHGKNAVSPGGEGDAVPQSIDSSGSKGPRGSDAEETSAALSPEEYIALPPTALEPTQLRTTPPRMQRVLDCYPRKDDPMKMEHEKQCLLTD